MAKVIVVNHVTLDGVMQAPARPDEDARDGFAHGGWAIPGFDEVITTKIGERMGGDRVGSLMAADLIDEYLLMIHPLVLGSGHRLFEAGHHARLRLADAVTTPTGVVIATYTAPRGS